MVEWVLTVRGKRMPLDKLPDREKGNVLIATRRDADLYDTVPGRAVVLRDSAAHAERSVGHELFTSHFATSPARRAPPEAPVTIVLLMLRCGLCQRPWLQTPRHALGVACPFCGGRAALAQPVGAA